MDLDLINATLAIMGKEPMADDGRPVGRVQAAAVRMHLEIRREVCEAQKWSGVNKIAVLEPEEGGIVPPDFGYVALLPADYVGLWNTTQKPFKICVVGEGEAARPRIAWSGDASITIDYSADVPYAVMNPLLKKVARERLAVVLTVVDTEDLGVRKGADDLATQAEMKCAARDALNRQDNPLFASSWDPYNLSSGYDPHTRTRGSW